MDYLILAVGWIVLSNRNDKHYIVWAMNKDADDESWRVGAKQVQLLDARWLVGKPYLTPRCTPASGKDLQAGKQAWAAYKTAINSSQKLHRPRKKPAFQEDNSAAVSYVPLRKIPTQLSLASPSVESPSLAQALTLPVTPPVASSSPGLGHGLAYGDAGTICHQMIQQSQGNMALHMALASVALETELAQQKKWAAEKQTDAIKEEARRSKEAERLRAHEQALQKNLEQVRREERVRSDDLVANHHELAKMVCSLSLSLCLSVSLCLSLSLSVSLCLSLSLSVSLFLSLSLKLWLDVL